MPSDDLTRMAREAGLHLPYWDDDQDPQNNPPAGWAMVSPIGPPLERFARAVECAAYKRAAQECDPHEDDDRIDRQIKREIAERIRALGRQHD